MPPTVPAPHTPGHYRVTFVCLGNICRSPTAEVVMARLVTLSPWVGTIEVSSRGTADWHVGKPMDQRSAAVLRDAGYDPTHHRANAVDPDVFESDLILAMDAANLRELRAAAPSGTDDRIRLFRTYDPDYEGHAQPPDVPDPYYGGAEGFHEVLSMIERTARALLDAIGAIL